MDWYEIWELADDNTSLLYRGHNIREARAAMTQTSTNLLCYWGFDGRAYGGEAIL